ncbi:MAG TPA: sialidase family protein [Hanamia sp.]|nr:sialidase family protein [Hanamia sp.]
MLKKILFTTLGLTLSILYLNSYGQSNKNKESKNLVNKNEHLLYHDLFISGQDRVSQYCIPSLVTTNKGTLIAVCDARVDKPGDAPNKIDLVLKRSFDGGKTWTKQKTIVNYPDNDAAADASMVVDKQTGVIWLAYDYAIADPQGQLGRIIRIHILESSDDGVIWSTPMDLSYLTRGKNFWLQNSPGRGLYAKGGVIVFPMYSILGNFNNPKQKQTVLIISKDHGRSWSMSNGIGDNNVEAQIASLPDGGIIANMRRPDGEGYRQIATTRDLGQSWSEVYTDSTLIGPGCQGSMINYQTHGLSFLLFSIPDDKKFRRDLVLHISDNSGKTWNKKLSIYKRSASYSADYSCLTKLPNGNIGILYDADTRKRIVFAQIPFQAILTTNRKTVQ